MRPSNDPDTILLKSGKRETNVLLAKAEGKFRRHVISNQKHQIEVTWDPDTQKAYQPVEYQLSCSCGNASGWNWRERGLNKDDTMPKKAITTVNAHIINSTREHNLVEQRKEGAEEPRLVARVHMTRVVHEWWIAHQTSDLAVELNISQRSGIHDNYPWKVLQKNTRRWKFVQSHRTKEQAVAAILKYVEKERYRGHGVEIVDANMELGIEAPVATIASSVRRLIDDAKELGEDPAPHELAAILQATDDGMAQLELLEPLREELRNRFGRALDLG